MTTIDVHPDRNTQRPLPRLLQCHLDHAWINNSTPWLCKYDSLTYSATVVVGTI